MKKPHLAVFTALLAPVTAAHGQTLLDPPLFTIDAATLAAQVPPRTDGALQPRCENKHKKPVQATPCSPANNGYVGHDQSEEKVYSPVWPDDKKNWAKILKSAPNRSSALLERAIAYKNDRQFILALADVNEILKTWHSSDDALRIRAMLYYYGGHYDLSLKDLEAANFWRNKYNPIVKSNSISKVFLESTFKFRNYVGLKDYNNSALYYDIMQHDFDNTKDISDPRKDIFNDGHEKLKNNSKFIYIKSMMGLDDYSTNVFLYTIKKDRSPPWPWENCTVTDNVNKAYSKNIIKFEVLQFHLSAPSNCFTAKWRENIISEMVADATERMNSNPNNRTAVKQLSEANFALAISRLVAGNRLGALSAYNMATNFLDPSIPFEAALLQRRIDERDKFANNNPAEAKQLGIVARASYTIDLDRLRKSVQGRIDELDLKDMSYQGCMNDLREGKNRTDDQCVGLGLAYYEGIKADEAEFTALANRTDGTPEQRQEARNLATRFYARRIAFEIKMTDR